MALQMVVDTGKTDEELVALLSKGNKAAFNELYDRYAQKLFAYFYRMLWKNRELAEDCTQELFVKIMKHAGNFEAGRSFTTWVYSIANNMCKNEYRKKETQSKHAAFFLKTNPMEQQKNPDLLRFKQAVHECTEALDDEKKNLFVLRFQEQMTVPQISAILNIPEGTVKSRIFYLLKELKEKLRPFENLPIYP